VARAILTSPRRNILAAGHVRAAETGVLSFRLRPGARQTMMNDIGIDSMSLRALTNVLAAPQGTPSSGQ
jgi:hypothetical protein